MHLWTMSPKINEVNECNPRVNQKKKNNVLKLQIEVDGKYTDTVYNGRYIDIFYRNVEGKKYQGGSNFVSKDLRFYINFGAFPNKAYIIQDSPQGKNGKIDEKDEETDSLNAELARPLNASD